MTPRKLEVGNKLLWTLALAFALSIPVAMVVGKYQLCHSYFPKMNAYACLFTSLPGTPEMERK